MFKGQITFDALTLRYPPSVAQFLMEEIEKAELAGHANQDVVHDLMMDDETEDQCQTATA